MKTGIPMITAALLLSNFNSRLSTAFAQGSLTPSGPPAPTMVTLSQIEPRTPISSLPYDIVSSGSYYITTNLAGGALYAGIYILASEVTLDLSGFTLFGVAGSLNGIDAGSGSNIVVRNGTLAGWGQDGLNAYGAINTRFEKLQLNGNAGAGLQAGTDCVVADCGAISNAAAGFTLQGGAISHCSAGKNGTGFLVTGAASVVSDCTAFGNAGDGINGTNGSVVKSCASYQNGRNGVSTGTNCTVKDCTANANSLNGIISGNYSTVIACTTCGNGGNYGIGVGTNCTVSACTASGNLNNGIIVGDNCGILGCTAGNNGNGGIGVNNYCTVKDCTTGSNGIAGIDVDGNGCQIAGNTCGNNHTYGILIFGSKNRVDGNMTGFNGSYGIQAESTNVGNNITRNFAPGNGFGGYGGFTGNNDFAPISSNPSTNTSPWLNSQ
jgi:hypothetical protein